MRRSPIGRAAEALGRPALLAHRGLHGDLKENSLAALAAVEGSGLDGVEFDVRFSADGVPLILHDATLRRTYGDPRAASELSSETLSSLGVPSLRDALGALPAELLLDVEVKEAPHDELFSLIRELRGEGAEGVTFSSFDVDVLRKIRERAPEWPLWLNVEQATPGLVDQARDLGVSGFSVEKGLLVTDLAREVSEAGLELATWTLRSRADREHLAHPGLTAACVEREAL
jgi:glycerophosphoryl diester phosphodiesterase